MHDFKQKIHLISQIFSENTASINIISGRFFIVSNKEEIKEKLLELGLQVETDLHGLKIIFKNVCENVIPYNETKYFESEFVDSYFVILDVDGSYCAYMEDSTDFSENSSPKFKTYCNNLIFYYKLYNYLKSEDFSDHHNSANNEIVIYTSTNGIFKIFYDVVPVLSQEDVSLSIRELLKYISLIELKSYFKNAFYIISNKKNSIAIAAIIDNASDIIEIAKRDYELVSKEFSFEKFKDSVLKEKEKYFSNIREILNKIFSQAIGIPISISATAFATYKLSDDFFILLIVLLSFIIYVIFYIRIQFIYRSDIEEIKSDFKRDFESISMLSGLSQDIIDIEKTKVERRIKNSFSTIDLLIVIIAFLAILMSSFIVYQMLSSVTSIFNILGVIVSVLSCFTLMSFNLL